MGDPLCDVGLGIGCKDKPQAKAKSDSCNDLLHGHRSFGVAKRDIKAGERISVDLSTFESDAVRITDVDAFLDAMRILAR